MPSVPPRKARIRQRLHAAFPHALHHLLQFRGFHPVEDSEHPASAAHLPLDHPLMASAVRTRSTAPFSSWSFCMPATIFQMSLRGLPLRLSLFKVTTDSGYRLLQAKSISKGSNHTGVGERPLPSEGYATFNKSY